MSNTVRCGPEAKEAKEYSVQLYYGFTNHEIQDKKFTLTQEQKELVDQGDDLEWFKKLLDDRFNSLFYSTKQEPMFYNFDSAFTRHRLEIKDKTIRVPTVVQKRLFYVEDNVIYICDPRFSPDMFICSKPYITPFQTGSYYTFEDFPQYLGNLYLSLNNYETYLYLIKTTCHDDLIKLCDSVCFLRELAETRGEDMKSTFIYLKSLFRRPTKYLIRQYENSKYALVGQYQDDMKDGYTTISEFFLKSKNEFKPWSGIICTEINVNDLDGIAQEWSMTLEKLKFAGQEYSFNKELTDIIELDYIQEFLCRVTQTINLPSYEGFKDFKTSWKSFKLEEMCGLIENNLTFIRSLAEIIDKDVYETIRFLNYLGFIIRPFRLGFRFIEPKFNFSFTPDQTGNGTIKCMDETNMISLYELQVKNMPNGAEHRPVPWSSNTNVLLYCIKLANKEYIFDREILCYRTTLHYIARELRSHVQRVLNNICYDNLENLWNRIDLESAMHDIR